MAELILIAVDDSNLLNFLVEIVKTAGFRVNAATSGQQAVELFWDEPADVVLLDFNMPGMTGIQALREIKEMQPSVPVFIMSGEGDIPLAVSAIKEGAHDFIVKPMDFDTLISTLKNAVPAVSEDPEAYDKNEPEILTERQKEILALTSAGHSSTAIADLLNISYRTVETHRERTMNKLNLRSRSEMISFALNNDILRKIK